jgi:predicted permease
MQNLIFSANIVFPLFLLMLVGRLLKRVGLFTEPLIAAGDKLTYRFLLPCVLFAGIYDADLHTAFNPRLLLFIFLAILSINLISYATVPLFVKDDARRGTMIQAMTRSNYILIGIPICQAAYGSAGLMQVALVAALYVPTVNFFAVLALTIYGEGKRNIKEILINIIKNPYIVTIAIALAINFIGIDFPAIFDSAVTSLANMATPFALMLLGAGFHTASLRQNWRAITIGTFCKLLLFPLAILTVAYFMGFRDLEFCLILTAFASPIAVSSYIMAKSMRCDHRLASQLIVASTLFSALTLFLLITAAKTFGIM